MVPPNQSESLRQSLSRAIIDHLADALLQHPSIDRLSNPVLRFEAFIEDGLYEHEPERSIDHAVPGGSRSPSASEPVVSVSWSVFRLYRATMSRRHTSVRPEAGGSLLPSDRIRI